MIFEHKKEKLQTLIANSEKNIVQLKTKIKGLLESNLSDDKKLVRYLENVSSGNGTLSNLIGEVFESIENFTEAYSYYLRAYQLENYIGMYNLARFYQSGKVVDKNYCKAYEILKALEWRTENSNVLYKLGYFYEMGFYVEKNIRMATSYYEKSLEKGNHVSAYNLGMLYVKDNNADKAFKYFKIASEGGIKKAYTSLGRCYEEKGEYLKAIEYYTKSGNAGIAAGVYNLAFMHEKGRGVKKDLLIARGLYEDAYNLGYLKAESALSYLKNNSQESLEELLEEYDLKKNNRDYQFFLASNYFKLRNYGKAAAHYKISMELGHSSAKLNLAKSYFYNKDYEEAEEIYSELEHLKDPVIYNSLARIYIYWKDYDTALYCIRLSLEIDKNDRTELMRAEIFSRKGDNHEAIEIYKGLYQRLTFNQKIQYVNCIISIKKYIEAIDILNEIILKTKDNKQNKARVILTLGYCYLKLKNKEKSKKCYEAVMKGSLKGSTEYLEAEKKLLDLKLQEELKKDADLVQSLDETREKKLELGLIKSPCKKKLVGEEKAIRINDQNQVTITTQETELNEKVDFVEEITKSLLKENTEIEKLDIYPLLTEKPKNEYKNRDIKFFAIGGGNEIGASSYYLEIEGSKFLIDSGLRIKENEFGENYPRFASLQESGLIDVFSELDAIFLTHGHLDHVGSLNRLFEIKGNTPIYSSAATRDIAYLLLADLISNKENDFFDEKLDLDTYKQLLVDKALTSISCKKIDEKILSLNNEFEAKFYNAGHILGARMLHIKVKDYNILFTGDFSAEEQYSVPSYQLPNNFKADLLITENTYGNHELQQDNSAYLKENELFEKINNSIQKKSQVLVPAFAIGRAQEMALYLEKAMIEGKIQRVPIYIDATAKYSSQIYEKHGVKIYSDIIKEARRNLIYKFKDEPCIIVTSSGMLMFGSKSYRYAKEMIEDKNSLIIFSGYLAENSLGKRLLHAYHSKKEMIRLEGKKFKIETEVYNFYKGAHATQIEIAELIEKVDADNIIMVHGFNSDIKEKNLYIDLHKKYSNSKNIHLAHNGLKIYI